MSEPKWEDTEPTWEDTAPTTVVEPDEVIPKWKSAALGAGQGVTANFADEGAALLTALQKKGQSFLPGGSPTDFGDAYRKARGAYRSTFAGAREANPITYSAGEMGGSLAQMAVPGLGPTAMTIPKLMALGGLQGLGGSESELTRGNLGDLAGAAGDVATGATIAGIMGKTVPMAVSGAKKVLGPVAKGAGWLAKKGLSAVFGPSAEAIEAKLARPGAIGEQTPGVPAITERLPEIFKKLTDQVSTLSDQAWSKLKGTPFLPKAEVIALIKGTQKELNISSGGLVGEADKKAMGALQSLASDIQRAGREAVPFTEGRAGEEAAAYKPLHRLVKRLGKINPEAVESSDIQELGDAALMSKKGTDLGHATEAAVEEGLLPKGANQNDLIEALQNEKLGKPSLLGTTEESLTAGFRPVDEMGIDAIESEMKQIDTKVLEKTATPADKARYFELQDAKGRYSEYTGEEKGSTEFPYGENVPQGEHFAETDLKEIIQKIQKNINWDDPKSEAANTALKKLEGRLNNILKTNNPDYAQAMVPLQEKTALLQRAKSYFGMRGMPGEEMLAPSQMTESKVATLAGKNKTFGQELAEKLPGGNLPQSVEDARLAAQFQGGATQGSRRTVGMGTIGAGAGTWLGSAFGMPQAGAMAGGAAGVLAGMHIDKEGGKIAGRLIDFYVKNNPQKLGKFAQPLINAAQRGAQEVGVTHWVLSNTNSEYRQKLKELMNESGNTINE